MPHIPRPAAQPAQFLASVTSVEEARIAIMNGAAIIDCKDPSAGALGALPWATVAEIAKLAAGRMPVSATIGDLPPLPETVVPRVEEMARTGVDIVKIGFFGGGRPEAAIAALAGLDLDGTRLVGLLLADQQPVLDLIPQMAAAGFAGVMLDTARKDGTTLLDHMDAAALTTFVAAAHRAGLFAGLAGSLSRNMVPSLVATGADVLGFRGALTEGPSRTSALSPAKVAEVARAIRSASKSDHTAILEGAHRS